jgi:hypothetical protein
VLWTGLMWSRIGPVEGPCEHGNEPSGSIKCWEILEWLRNWRVLEKGSAPWGKYSTWWSAQIIIYLNVQFFVPAYYLLSFGPNIYFPRYFFTIHSMFILPLGRKTGFQNYTQQQEKCNSFCRLHVGGRR